MPLITVRNRATSIINDFIKTNNICGKFLIPANICPIIPLVFLKNNIKIKFIDINLKDLDMDKKLVLENVKQFDGMLWNNSYGKEVDNSSFFKKCKTIKKQFFIIDDKCLSKPKLSFKKSISSDLELYSTGYSKYCDLSLGCYELSKKKIKFHPTIYNKNLYDKIIKKFNYSINHKKIFSSKKNNWLESSNGIAIKEYFLNIKEYKKKIKVHKKNINYIYNKILPNEIKIDNKLNNWRYNVLVSQRKILIKKIFKENLFASTHYYPSSKIFQNIKMKNSDYIGNNIVNLFNDLRFDEKMAKKTALIIKQHFDKFGPLKKIKI